MKFDDVLREIGEFGPYQKRVYFLAALPMVLAAFETVSVVFIFNIPPHRCAIPGYPNDRYNVINETHAQILDASIPKDEDGKWSRCLIYSDVSTDAMLSNYSDVSSGIARKSNFSNATTTCDRWVYDRSVFESTIPTDFNIVCHRSVHRATSNMLAEMGNLLSALASGFLADRFGRKIPFYMGGVALITGGLGIAFTTTLVTINICRFIIGSAGMTLWTNGLVLGMEIVGPSKRVFAGTCIEFMWCVGMLILLLLAFLVRQWRYLEIALSIPSFFLLSCWWLIPESPRWLAAKGRNEEALKTLKKIANSNGTVLPRLDDVTQLMDAEKSLSFRHVFKSRELILRMSIVYLNMFVLVMIYYALMYNISNLAGDLFINFLINAIMETLGLTSPYLVLDRLGRKKVYCGSVILGGAACVICVVPALVEAPDWVIIVLAVAGRFFVCVAFSTLYIYGAELFPTVIRASTMSVGVTFSRLGGIVSPYLADAGILAGRKLEKALPMIVMGTPALVVGLLSLWLPETKGTKMPETFDDIHLGTSTKRRCICSNGNSKVDRREVTAGENGNEMNSYPC